MGEQFPERPRQSWKCSPSFYSPLWLMPPPRPNLRLMPPLMPGTHTTVTVIPDTTVPTATVLDMDGVVTMVDITGTPDTDTGTGSVMLKLKLNLRLRLKPTPPSSTPASTAMDLPTDTLIMAMELTPALTTLMLMLPPSTPPL